MATERPDEHERRAGGLDFDDHDTVRERATSMGTKMVEEGPEFILDEIENLLPEEWREQIRHFPIAAVVLGMGVGVWLGMKKSNEIIAAATSLVSAAAMANVSQVMERVKPS